MIRLSIWFTMFVVVESSGFPELAGAQVLALESWVLGGGSLFLHLGEELPTEQSEFVDRCCGELRTCSGRNRGNRTDSGPEEWGTSDTRLRVRSGLPHHAALLVTRDESGSPAGVRRSVAGAIRTSRFRHPDGVTVARTDS